jgi:hypothetical protein
MSRGAPLIAPFGRPAAQPGARPFSLPRAEAWEDRVTRRQAALLEFVIAAGFAEARP